jgi:uncharacterized protein
MANRASLETQVRRGMPQFSEERGSELIDITERLVSALRPDCIYVFGSQARGDARPDSDIDLLLVVPSTEQPTHRLAQLAYHAAAPHSLDLDILVMSRDEFEWRSRALASLPATVLREGRILYAAA